MGRDVTRTKWSGEIRVCGPAGGETTVILKGDGIGGRCQELALAAGRDGTDGPTLTNVMDLVIMLVRPPRS